VFRNTDSSSISQNIRQKNEAHEPREKTTIKEAPNKIQIRNEDAEKIGEPRLLQIGRKDTRKDDQRLKLKNGAI
jgi:hypothetical protein